MNHETQALRRQARAPGADPRARPLRGLEDALARSRSSRRWRGIQVPGTPWATPPAELEKLAGYGRTSRPARAEARRLLREAGVPDGFAFTFKNRGIPQPYEPVGIWLIDQWRQIGLNVKQETIEASRPRRRCCAAATSTWPCDAQCSYVVEPDIDIAEVPVDRGSPTTTSAATRTRCWTTSSSGRRGRWTRRSASATSAPSRSACSTRRSHYIYTLQWHRIVPHSAKVRGWTITPAHFLNQQLDTVWLAE